MGFTWSSVGVVAVVSLLLVTLARCDERFIGWMGETYKADDFPGVTQHFNASLDNMKGLEKPREEEPKRWVEQLSWHPRAFLFHKLLTDEEADHLVKLALPRMKRSMVVSDDTGDGVVSNYRTSYGTFLSRNEDEVTTRVQEKVANWTHLPSINQEDIQILRYSGGQQYRPHMDVLDEDEDGARVCTVLIYLADCEDGGETAFPQSSAWLHPEQGERLGPVSDCAKGHVAAKARKGDALLFFSLDPSGEQDPTAEHTGCPVQSGVKWTATFWVHTQAFRPDTFEHMNKWIAEDAGDCRDFLEHCRVMAENGRCEDDSLRMKGDLQGDGDLGFCRKTCGVCEPCDPDNRECYFRNRERAGYLNLDELWPENGMRQSVPARE